MRPSLNNRNTPRNTIPNANLEKVIIEVSSIVDAVVTSIPTKLHDKVAKMSMM
jgi:hypothetical protein